jgi:glutamine cyclotransferase
VKALFKIISAVCTGIFAIVLTGFASDIEPVRCFPAPPGEGLTWDGRNLWLSSVVNSKIYKIDPDNGNILDELPSPGSSVRGGDLAFDGSYLWLVDPDPVFGGLFQIDPDNGLVVKTIPLSSLPFSAAGHSGLTWGDDALWLSAVAGAILPTIYKIDPVDGSLLRSIPAPTGKFGFTGLAWSGTRGDDYLLLSDGGFQVTSKGFYEIDMSSSSVSDFMQYNFAGQGLAYDGESLWSTNSLQGICQFDPDSYNLFYR